MSDRDRFPHRTSIPIDGSTMYSVSLPRDLTMEEAEYVCGIVRALAFPADQLDLFADEPRVIPSRTADPVTSHSAEPPKMRADSQRAKLLRAFSEWDFTDEEAMEYTIGVSPLSEYSKRCSELREAGYIEATGETREGSSGHQRIVSRITAKGRAWIRENT